MTRFSVIVRRTISDDTKIAFVPNLKAAFIAITSFQILLTLRVSLFAPNSKRRDRLFAPPRRVGISKRFWRTPRYRQTDSHSPIPQYLPFTLRYGVFAVRLRSGHCHLSDNRFRGRSRLRSAFDGRYARRRSWRLKQCRSRGACLLIFNFRGARPRRSSGGTGGFGTRRFPCF